MTPERVITEQELPARFAELQKGYKAYWELVRQTVTDSVHEAFPETDYNLAVYSSGYSRIKDAWMKNDNVGKYYRHWLYGAEDKERSKPFLHYSINWFPDDSCFNVSVWWTGSLDHTNWGEEEGISPFGLKKALQDLEPRALANIQRETNINQVRKRK